MGIEETKDKILAHIRAQRDAGATVGSLINCYPEMHGECSVINDEYNIVWFCGLSDEAADAIMELRRGKQIGVKACHFLVLLIDGSPIPKYPLVKSDRKYKTPHFLPCVLVLPEYEGTD